MKYKELLHHAEMCQLAADEISFKYINEAHEISILCRFQSHCDFNLFWLYSISPEVVLHIGSIEFLQNNSDKFKRKLTIKEILKYDSLIGWNKPETFSDFLKLIKA